MPSGVTDIYELPHLCQGTSAAVNGWLCLRHDADVWPLTSGSALWQWLRHLEGSFAVCASVCQCSWVRMESLCVVMLSWPLTSTSTWTHRHTCLCFSYPVSANNSYLRFISVELSVKSDLICWKKKEVILKSLYVDVLPISKQHWPRWCSTLGSASVKLLYWRFIWSVFQ